MLQLTAATLLLGLFGLTAALEAPPRPFDQMQACAGHLVYFDYSSCPHHDNSWKPTARSFGANAEYQAGFAGAPNTICIASERFDGYLYIDRDGAGTNQQTVRVSVDSTLSGDKTYGSAWVQSRSDDHIGHEGTRGKLPVISESGTESDISTFADPDAECKAFILL